MEASNLRSRARAALAGNWAVAIGTAAVAYLLGGILTGASFFPDMPEELAVYFPALRRFSRALEQGWRLGNFTLSFRSGLLGLTAFVLGGVMQLGYARFLLKQQDGQEADFNDLFSQFDRFGTGFAQKFLRGLYVYLWSLLLVIPDIIKSLSYAMTPFILAEHPNLTASQAIDLSMQMMEGHKMDLFLLDLSFFGWTILAVLTGNLGFLVLNPYENAAHAAFYRQLQVENRYTSYE